MTNDLENRSPESSGDLLTYAFTEDAVDEADALASVGDEEITSGLSVLGDLSTNATFDNQQAGG